MNGGSGEFDGKVIVVTGGSTGIGAATVQRLAAAGARVVFCTHDPDTLDSSAGRTDRVTGVVADVRSADDMQKLIATARRLYGGVDGLVCSAGIQTYGTVDDTSLHDWNRVLEVNLTGVFLASKYAMLELRARGGGSIVAVSSIQGRTPNPRVLGTRSARLPSTGSSGRWRLTAPTSGSESTPSLLDRCTRRC